jgi:hypothetical protein
MSRPLPLVIALAFLLTGCASLDDRDRYFLQSYQVASPTYVKMTHGKRLSAGDIIALAEAGVPGPYIMEYLRKTKTHVALSAADLLRLRHLGASDGFIRFLEAPPERPEPRGNAWWLQNSAS